MQRTVENEVLAVEESESEEYETRDVVAISDALHKRPLLSTFFFIPSRNSFVYTAREHQHRITCYLKMNACFLFCSEANREILF